MREEREKLNECTSVRRRCETGKKYKINTGESEKCDKWLEEGREWERERENRDTYMETRKDWEKLRRKWEREKG